MEILLIIIGIVTILLFFFTGVVIAKAQKHKLDNNTTSNIKLFEKKEVIKTGFTCEYTNGEVFDIYISSTGSAFYYKTSLKTGKQYKYYLGEKLSREICKDLGYNYTPIDNKKSQTMS